MPPKDVTAIAHELLTKARDGGSEDEVWEAIFEQLRATPAALVRPKPRKMSLLQQAAYWGHLDAVQTLVKEFKADINEVTDDDDMQTAAEVAESQDHHEVAEFLNEVSAEAKKEPPAAPEPEPEEPKPKKPKPAEGKPTEADVALAHELLSTARDEGAEDSTWETIITKLREQPAAVIRPEVRKYSLLHQAAFWGKKDTVEVLIKEFGQDPKAPTADDDALDAAAVAESEGYDELAEWIRGLADGSEEKAAPAASAKAATGDASSAKGDADDAAAAAAISPYDRTKAEKQVDADAGCVQVWLCLRTVDGERRWELYSPDQHCQIEAARSKGAANVKVGGKTLDFGSLREVGAAEGDGKVRSFHVLWEWDSGEGGKAAPEWKPYPAEVQWQLEAAMCAKDAVCDITASGTKYFVDLVGLRQYNATDAFRCRRVRRRGVPLREPFPEKVRWRSGAWLALNEQPDYWECGPGGLSDGTPKRHDLPKDSPVVSKISMWMNSTIRTGHAAAYGQVPGHGGPTKSMEVVRVEVVQQPALWRRYCCYKGQLKANKAAIKAHEGTAYLKKHPMALPKCEWLDADVGEAYFWHGSGKSSDGSVDLIDAIVSVGHEPSDENSEVMEVSDGASSRFAKNTSMFGAGVYLADISSKANLYVPCPKCYQGAYFRDPCHCSMAEVEKAEPYRMLLCRAVMGRVYVEKKYKDDRYKGDFNPAKKLDVDSVMGEAVKGQLAFREYVVYNDSASYPEFIVHYRRRAHAMKFPAMPPAKKAKLG